MGAAFALPQTSAAAQSKKGTTARTKSASTSSQSASARKGKSARAKAVAATPARYRQASPSPDRYREIQQALVDKGYLKSQPNGVWDTESSDALKQFQTEKNLPPTGKITSASLIGLGLGPKTAGASGMIADSTAPTDPAPPAALPAGAPPASAQ